MIPSLEGEHILVLILLVEHLPVFTCLNSLIESGVDILH